MPTFLITRTYKYTATIKIEASDKCEAFANAGIDDEEHRNIDDTMLDETIKQIAD